MTEDGLCIFCRQEVLVSTSPEEVDEAIEADKHRHVRREIVDGKWQKILRKECSLCGILYDTPYPHSRYHNDTCREEASNLQRVARKGSAVFCLFCSKFIPTKDKRRKFCNETCRNDLRRKGPMSLGPRG